MFRIIPHVEEGSSLTLETIPHHSYPASTNPDLEGSEESAFTVGEHRDKSYAQGREAWSRTVSTNPVVYPVFFGNNA